MTANVLLTFFLLFAELKNDLKNDSKIIVQTEPWVLWSVTPLANMLEHLLALLSHKSFLSIFIFNAALVFVAMNMHCFIK